MWERLAGALLRAVRDFLFASWRVIRQLFHEMTGAIFVLFTVLGGVAVWREWQRGSALWLVALAAAFTGMMAWFAFESFRSARRIR
jgi:hypothetical protein